VLPLVHAVASVILIIAPTPAPRVAACARPPSGRQEWPRLCDRAARCGPGRRFGSV